MTDPTGLAYLRGAAPHLLEALRRDLYTAAASHGAADPEAAARAALAKHAGTLATALHKMRCAAGQLGA